MTLALVLGVLGVLGIVVYWVRRVVADVTTVGSVGAAFQLEKQRDTALEAAAAKSRTKLATEFNAKAAAAVTATDAARVLREITGTDDPTLN